MKNGLSINLVLPCGSNSPHYNNCKSCGKCSSPGYYLSIRQYSQAPYYEKPKYNSYSFINPIKPDSSKDNNYQRDKVQRPKHSHSSKFACLKVCNLLE